jgi:hypothetical protein
MRDGKMLSAGRRVSNIEDAENLGKLPYERTDGVSVN